MNKTAKKFKAIVTKKVSHYKLPDDPKRYVPGDIVEVTEHLYKRGCATGILKPAPKPEPVEKPKPPTEETKHPEKSTDETKTEGGQKSAKPTESKK